MDSFRALKPILLPLLIAGGLLLLLVILVIVSFFSRSTNTNQLTPTPSPSPLPLSLTEQEKKLPHATPQPFRNAVLKDTGTLVVTSSVEGATVLLDTSNHPGAPDEPIRPGNPWPHNTTPFTVLNMPVGRHSLEAIKPPKYDMARTEFIIIKNEVTRVNIELIPLRTSE